MRNTRPAASFLAALCLAILMFLAFSPYLPAQSLSLANYTSGGPNTPSTLKSLAHTPEGLIYCAGTFSDTFSIQGQSVSTSRSNAVFLAKFDADLSLIWLQKIAENQTTELTFKTRPVVEASGSGDVFVCLNYADRLFISEDSIGEIGGRAIELMKLDPDGNLIWSIPVEGEKLGKRGMVISEQGHLLLTGGHSDNVFTKMYSEDGELLWTRSAGSPNSPSYGDYVDTDDEDNTFIAGLMPSSNLIQFDSYHVDVPVGLSNLSFIAKYDANGIIQWVRYVYSTTFAEFAVFGAIQSDVSGNITCAGSYTDSQLNFSNGYSSVGPQPNGFPTSFLTTFDPDGNRLWVRVNPHSDIGTGGAVEMRRDGDTQLVLDSYSGTIQTQLGPVATIGQIDLLLGRYDSNGNELQDLRIGGALFEIGLEIEVSDHLVYLLGTTSSSTMHVGADEFDPEYANSVFLIKLVAGPDAVGELASAQRLALFPNPNPGSFTLQTPASQGEIRVTDVLGALVHRRVVNGSPSVAIELPELAEGVYTVQFRSSNSQLSERMVVVR